MYFPQEPVFNCNTPASPISPAGSLWSGYDSYQELNTSSFYEFSFVDEIQTLNEQQHLPKYTATNLQSQGPTRSLPENGIQPKPVGSKKRPTSSRDQCIKENTPKRRKQNYCCGVCQRTFAYYGSFSSHLRTHSGERPFSCDTCEQTFTVRSTLIKHKRLHTGVRPYICRFCDRRFTQSGNMLRHQRRFH